MNKNSRDNLYMFARQKIQCAITEIVEQMALARCFTNMTRKNSKLLVVSVRWKHDDFG
jgi:hypothetical protein